MEKKEDLIHIAELPGLKILWASYNCLSDLSCLLLANILASQPKLITLIALWLAQLFICEP